MQTEALYLFCFGFGAAVILIAIWEGLRSRTSARAGAAQSAPSSASELRRAMSGMRTAFLGVAAFSGLSNVLMLTGSFFMLEVYDRVLPSRSTPTLLVLCLLATGLFVAQGLIDLIRSRILARLGALLEERLAPRVFEVMVTVPLRSAMRGDGQQPVRDLDSVRNFLSGLGPTALFDLPWMPLYLVIIFMFHPILGYAAIAGAVLLVILTLVTEALTRAPSRAANAAGVTRARLGEASVRNAEALAAMGLAGRMADRWRRAAREHLAQQQRVTDIAGSIGTISKVVRMLLQSGMLALGAWLVIRNEATGGIIIAASILTSRALAPVELAISHWRGFVAARQSWQRLGKLFSAAAPKTTPMQLSAAVSRLDVDALCVAAPGTTSLIVMDVQMALKAGQGLGVIGPSASGKSSLARALVGVWPAARGRVRLDGAALDQWSTADLGRNVGYLPQDVELFAGSVGQNIARFDPDAKSEAIIAAARTAGVHDLVVALKNGYDTEVGDQGAVLSAGQRQRIALARALYGDPFLVVLDEPNSNLDAEGEAALTRAIHSVRERGGIAVVVAHRPSALVALDMVLAMSRGNMVAFGPKDEVLGKVLGTGSPAHVPLKVVPEAARSGT